MVSEVFYTFIYKEKPLQGLSKTVKPVWELASYDSKISVPCEEGKTFDTIHQINYQTLWHINLQLRSAKEHTSGIAILLCIIDQTKCLSSDISTNITIDLKH